MEATENLTTTTLPSVTLNAAPTSAPSNSPISFPINSTSVFLTISSIIRITPSYMETTNDPTTISTIATSKEIINTKITNGTDSDSEAQMDSDDDAILIVSIIVSIFCIVAIIIVVYFVSRRRQISQSVIEEMQLRKSIQPIVHKKEHVLSKDNRLDNNRPEIKPQSPPLNNEGCDMRIKEYVDEGIIIKGEDEETGKGTRSGMMIDDDEFIVETKGCDSAAVTEENK